LPVLTARLTGSEAERQRLHTRFELVSLVSNESLWGIDVNAENPLHLRDAFWWTDQVRRLPQPARQLERAPAPDDKAAAIDTLERNLNDRNGYPTYHAQYRLALQTASTTGSTAAPKRCAMNAACRCTLTAGCAAFTSSTTGKRNSTRP
jgi:hypothetical protein